MSKADEFALSSGLPWADTEVEITAATFGYNSFINNGNSLCANLTATNTDGDSSEQSFTVGDGWEAMEKGARIQSDNPAKKISKQSNYGRLLASAVRAVGGDPEDMPFDSAKEIEGWIGTRWQTGSESVKVKNPSTGVEKEKDAIVLVKFLGRSEGSGSGASSKPAAAKGTGLDPELEEKLIQLAKDSSDHEEFVEKGLDLVEGNAKAVSAVMSKKADGIFARAQAD